MKRKKLLYIIVILIGTLLFGNNVQASNREKGDINGDNKISIIDISQLKLHLVGMKEIATEYQTYADVNGDNKISVTDLSRLKLQIVGLGNRALTDEELNAIKEMIEKDEFILTKGFNQENLSVAQMVWLTRSTGISEGENIYGVDIIKLHFGDDEPSGGDVYVVGINDIIKMYKLVFDVDISREELIGKLESSYHKEIDAVTVQFEWTGGCGNLNISDAYYNNGQYFATISWYSDSIKNHVTNEPYGYTRTGILILKKVEDRYCYVSYANNTGRRLNETEKSEINTYLNENKEFLSRASYIYFGGLELWNQHAWEQMVTVCRIINKDEIKYNEEELDNKYLQVSGQNQLAGGPVYGTTFTALKTMYKEKFNMDLTKEYMEQMIEKFNQYKTQDKMYYIEDEDLILLHPEWTVGAGYDFEMVDALVENNIYTIYLDFKRIRWREISSYFNFR